MSFTQHHHVVPGVGASPIGQYLLVKQNAGVNNSFVQSGTYLEAPFGLTLATVPSAGADCAVVFEGVAKAIAGTAINAGDIVAHATAGKLGPIQASGVASALGNVQAPKFAIGRALENCAAGGIFAVALDRMEIF